MDKTQWNSHLALRVDHVEVVPELIAQAVVDVAVEEAALPALLPPQKIVLRCKSL